MFQPRLHGSIISKYYKTWTFPFDIITVSFMFFSYDSDQISFSFVTKLLQGGNPPLLIILCKLRVSRAIIFSETSFLWGFSIIRKRKISCNLLFLDVFKDHYHRIIICFISLSFSITCLKLFHEYAKVLKGDAQGRLYFLNIFAR